MLNKCSLCGFCKQTCPVFKATLKETDSPRTQANLIKKDILDIQLLKCTLCNACFTDCPSDIDLADLMREKRSLLIQQSQTRANKEMIDNIRKHGNPYGNLKEIKEVKKLWG